MKTFVIDGNHFSTEDGFYNEVQAVLTTVRDWEIGHNTMALSDVLYGGFGVFEENEPIRIIWKNFAISKRVLSYEVTIERLQELLACKIAHPEIYLQEDIESTERALENAKKHVGWTILDEIVGVFQSYDNIDFVTELFSLDMEIKVYVDGDHNLIMIPQGYFFYNTTELNLPTELKAPYTDKEMEDALLFSLSQSYSILPDETKESVLERFLHVREAADAYADKKCVSFMWHDGYQVGATKKIGQKSYSQTHLIEVGKDPKPGEIAQAVRKAIDLSTL